MPKKEQVEEEKPEEETEETKNPDKFSLVEVPTGSALAIQTPDGKYINQEQAIVDMLNTLREIKVVIGNA